jgi:Raf kinase inhibitor-like YbhB/YbcL family protein
MRRRVLLTTIVVLFGAGTTLSVEAATKPKLVLTSTAFDDGGTIPIVYTCNGAGKSPQLAWKNVPPRTKQFALIVQDPDTPIGTFVHWVVAGMTAKTRAIPEDSEPPGAFGGLNGAGRPGWIPSCPPAGPPHHYIFTLYALDKKVSLPPGVTADTLRNAMKGKILATAKLTGLYGT